jgi:hypothetical protein
MKSALRRCIFVLLCALAGCEQRKSLATVEDLISQSISAASLTNSGFVNIASITPFPWDKVFFFHPYTAPAAIDDALGFVWKNPAKDEIEFSDGFELIVFVRHSRVVKIARIKRSLCDWDLAGHNGFVAGKAVFSIGYSGADSQLVARIWRPL